ncbi:MAG: ATP-binding cassette domain-containing protein, partial [Pseudomonadota bacterium]
MTALCFDHVALSVDGRSLFAPLTAQVAPGDTLCLTGPSGCGKSSLLNFACGFLPDGMEARGRVRFGEDDLTQTPPVARRLGLLFQDALLFAHLSVADNVAFGLKAGGGRAERRARVDDALARVGLTGFGSRDPA